jgi:cytochrome b561
VDYRTGTRTPWTEYSLVNRLLHWQMALHEWVGLLAYRVAGRA